MMPGAKLAEKFRLPWLHPHRAEVLAALALSVRLRQPLAPGLARLAEADPSLHAWHLRLDAGLRSGEPLGALLSRHRVLDKKSAARLDAAVDPVAEFATITNDSYTPLRGMFLIRWFPVILAMTLCVPLVILQISHVSSFFEQTYLDLGIRLPNLTLMVMDMTRGLLFLPMVVTGLCMMGLLEIVSGCRGLRHLPHLWWVEVRRTEALLALVTAAHASADTLRVVRWPVNWLAVLRISATRQRRPMWDKDWRTYRILTRWRATGLGWRKAAHATTALGVLQALELIPENCDPQDLRNLEQVLIQRQCTALESARAQAWALLMVGFVGGCGIGVLALAIPLAGPFSYGGF